MLSTKLQILSSPDKAGMAYGIAQIVDNIESLEHMLKSLSTAKQLALDAEGMNLGRTGKLCLLSVAPAPPPDTPPDVPGPVFLLDVTSLSTAAFTHKPGLTPSGNGSSSGGGRGRSRSTTSSPSSSSCGLRCLKEVLECPSVTKLFYDVRCDAEALYHQHGVSLRGVVDLQLSEVAYRRYGPVVRRVGYVIGLTRALECYLAPELRERWQSTAVDKRLLHETFNRDLRYWDRRPLSQEQVRYAADDVLYLHHLHREFTAALAPPILERVAMFSQYRVQDSQSHVVAIPGKDGTLAGSGSGGGSDPTRAIAPPGL
ncbi:3'-5' exonuclease [Volvox carteri f. nagariensis]|uniref:3'-5' exonuclease n=1 Tax=Volvox carteri f. nagariensis TaxID=3068 RepID=D8TUI2_VOLCA|nr:3'-5' exonuclease [Volvox carteri f. nagariensis]EFJ48828.1 3'-5' exonuclease [Volvox carteri f. nagariensis]|eukprot:XP_002950160.1 3'-5' exonuclease [Volvox carteri f. nagariensis]